MLVIEVKSISVKQEDCRVGVASVSYRSSSQIFIQRERSATYRPISEFRFAVSFINKLLATIIDDEALQGDMKKKIIIIFIQVQLKCCQHSPLLLLSDSIQSDLGFLAEGRH